MTDQTNIDQPTAPSVSAEQMERIARVRQRRAVAHDSSAGNGDQALAGDVGPTRRLGKLPRRRRHVAQGSRILAAGLGATTMFGIVTVLGLDNPVSGAEKTGQTVPATQPTAPVPVVAPAPPIQIVIHRVPASVDPQAAPEPARPVTAPVPTVEAPAPPSPVQLTANPVVQTITVSAPARPRSQTSSAPAPAPQQAPAPAPAATTSGSG